MAYDKHQLIEFFKCKYNPDYFIENYIKLSLVGGDRPVKLYNKQKEFLDIVYNEHHVITLKTRQTGLSTVSQMAVSHIMTFYKNVTIGCISKDGVASTAFCRHVMGMIDSLPPWIKPQYVKRTEQSFILDNGCKFFASQVNDANPEGTLRGFAINLLIIDEASFITKIDEAYTSIAPTLFKAQQDAKILKIPYGTVIISTPNKTVGRGKWYYQNWLKAHAGNSIYKPFKLHWKEIPEFADNPEWYKTQCELLDNIPWKIAQELNMEFVASNNSFFDTETIKVLNSIQDKPKYTMDFFRCSLNIYDKYDPHKFYLIGVDSSSEGGQDSSTVVVTEFQDLKQVAEYRANHIRVENLCKVVEKVANIFPNNLLVVESNSYGNQVCEYLTGRDKYYNIYKTENKSDIINTAAKTQKPKYKYGLYTDTKSRPLMIDALYTLVKDNPNIIKSEALALELIGLVDRRGKIQADEGEQDDLAIAFAFCCYVRLYDPPLGMATKFTHTEDSDSMIDIASWNNDDQIHSDSNLAELHNLINESEDDNMTDILNRSNKLINSYLKNHLTAAMDKNNNNTIDIFELMNNKNSN